MPRKPKVGLPKTPGFRVSAETSKAIEDAMRQERRIESDICRSLLVRGLAAYKRDGQLFESLESRKAAAHGNKS